jgi:hypothetical protein
MEVHLAARGLPAASEVRSTILVSGIQAIRARGLYQKYLESLPPEARDRFSTLIVGLWLPVEEALIHYRAVDRLGLDAREIESIGAEVAQRINKSALSIAVQLSRRVGVTPWGALSMAQRINDLNWHGGDITVYKLGPKEALYEWTGQPCAAVPYFVTSFGGYLRALASLFADKAHARAIPERCSSTVLTHRLSWI